MVDGAAILAMQGASDPCVAPATIRSTVHTNKLELFRAWIFDPGLFLIINSKSSVSLMSEKVTIEYQI